MMKRIAKLGILLMIGLSMCACAGLFGFGGTSWKEEVLLHDGSKIIVSRSVSRGGRHENRQQPPIKEQSLTFTMPLTKERITWKDPFTADIGGASFLPKLLDMFDGVPYLVAMPMGCISYNKWGRPNPPYVVFKHDGIAWQRISLAELPAVIKTPNLIPSSPDDEAKKTGQDIVSAEAIRKMYEDYKKPEYRTILREPLAKVQEGCGEMIYTNDGWEGLGFFESPGSFNACLKYCDRRNVSKQNCPCEKLFKGEKQ